MNFTVKDPPEYSDKMRMLETSDPDHADVFNALFAQLLNNDVFLKKMADEAVPRYEKRFMPVVGWNRLFRISGQYATAFLVTLRRLWNVNPAEVCSFSVTATQFQTLTGNISQLGHADNQAHFLSRTRIGFNSKTAEFCFDVYYKSGEQINEIDYYVTGLSAEQTLIMGGEIDEENEVYLEAETFNGGIFADRAIADGDGRNIAEMYVINMPHRYRIESEEQFENILNEVYNSTPDAKTFQFSVSMVIAIPGLGGGVYYITGYRTDTNAGYIEAKSYGFGTTKYPRFLVRNKIGGVWREWVNFDNFNRVHVIQKQEDMPQTLNNGDTLYFRNAGSVGNPIIIEGDLTTVFILNVIVQSSQVEWVWDGSTGVRNINLYAFYGNVTIKQGPARLTSKPYFNMLYASASAISIQISAVITANGGFSGSLSCPSKSSYLLGDMNAFSDVHISGFICNMHFVKVQQNVVFTDCTGRAIDERGMNLIEVGKTVPHYDVSTTTEFNAALNDFYNKTLDRQKMSFSVNVTTDGLPLGGGMWYMEGFKTQYEYGYLIAYRYNDVDDTGVIIKTSSRINGTWKAWKKIG